MQLGLPCSSSSVLSGDADTDHGIEHVDIRLLPLEERMYFLRIDSALLRGGTQEFRQSLLEAGAAVLDVVEWQQHQRRVLTSLNRRLSSSLQSGRDISVDRLRLRRVREVVLHIRVMQVQLLVGTEEIITGDGDGQRHDTNAWVRHPLRHLPRRGVRQHRAVDRLEEDRFRRLTLQSFEEQVTTAAVRQIAYECTRAQADGDDAPVEMPRGQNVVDEASQVRQREVTRTLRDRSEREANSQLTASALLSWRERAVYGRNAEFPVASSSGLGAAP
jgi:hypothetical protein